MVQIIKENLVKENVEVRMSMSGKLQGSLRNKKGAHSKEVKKGRGKKKGKGRVE